MARSATTRKGNGAGWGGPANGPGHEAGPKAVPFEPGNQVAVGYHDMSRAQRLAALDERKWQIAMGDVTVEPVQLAAINSYEDRHFGKARQSMELSGVDGAPLMPPTLTVMLVPPKSDGDR